VVVAIVDTVAVDGAGDRRDGRAAGGAVRVRLVLVLSVLYAVLGALLFVLGLRMFGELALAVALALAGVVMVIVTLCSDPRPGASC
jgi:hypothetical protein